MKSENTGPKDIKEDNSCKEQKVSFVIWLTVVVHIYQNHHAFIEYY